MNKEFALKKYKNKTAMNYSPITIFLYKRPEPTHRTLSFPIAILSLSLKENLINLFSRCGN
jgi:hypothetical protein